MRYTLVLPFLIALLCLPAVAADAPETFTDITTRLGSDTAEAWAASPYRFLSEDYFARFYRHPAAQPAED